MPRAIGLFGMLAIAVAPAIADPASAYCESRGGTIVVDTAASGAKVATCVFADGTRVNAGAYFRSTHRTR